MSRQDRVVRGERPCLERVTGRFCNPLAFLGGMGNRSCRLDLPGERGGNQPTPVTAETGERLIPVCSQLGASPLERSRLLALSRGRLGASYALP